DQCAAVGGEADLARTPGERWRVQAAAKLVGGKGSDSRVTVQVASGTHAWIDGLRGVGKWSQPAILPNREPADVGVDVADGVEAGTTRVEHIEEIPVDGQAGRKQSAGRHSVDQRQPAI